MNTALPQTGKAPDRMPGYAKLFRDTFEQAAVGIAHVDIDGRWLRVNRKLCNLLGYSESELRQLHWQEITHPDDLTADLSKARQLREGLIPGYSIDKRYRRKDGSMIWTHLTISAVPGLTGKPEYLVAVLEDIHQRKVVEQRRDAEHTIARILAEADTLSDAAPQVLATVCRTCGWNWGALWLLDEAAGVLRCVETWHNPALDLAAFEQISRSTTFAEGVGLPGRVWQTGQPTAIEDMLTATNFPRRPVALRVGLTAAAGFPVRLGERILGTLDFLGQDIQPLDPELVDMLAVIGGQLGQFIDRKRSEQFLQQSEERFRSLVDATSQVVWATDARGEPSETFTSWKDFTGQSPEEARQGHWIDAVHPADRERVKRIAAGRLSHNQPTEVEYRLRRHDGVYRDMAVRAVPVMDQNGRVREWVGICTDITDRKRAERWQAAQSHVLELLASGKSLQEVLTALVLAIEEQSEGVRASVLLLDEQRQHVLVEAAPHLPETYNRAIHGAEIGPRAGSCGTAAYTGKLVIVEDVMSDPLWADYRALAQQHNLCACWSHPIRSSSQRVLGTFAMYAPERRGPTAAELRLIESAAHVAGVAIERRQAEAALQRAKEEAEAANRAKDHFLAVLSHELRTPLTPALARLGLLQREKNLPRDLREGLEVIRRNIELESRLISDLLDLTRIERGKLELHPQSVNAHQQVRAAADIFERDIRAKSLHLELDLEAKQHYVQADPVRLQQVFWNLLSNAVKYTPQHGSITIRSRNVEPGGILRVQVIDTGIGIEPQTMQRLFTAFEQGEQTLTRRFGGLGLGLSISKSLVDAQGGSLTASSAGKDQGSTFTVELKTTAPPAAAAVPTAPAAEPGKHRSVSILLVEDNEDTLRVMSRLLEAYGHRVKTAASMHEAIESAKEQPDLIICDIGLPDGTGWDLMRLLRQQQPVRGIALSGFASDEDIQRSKGVGFVTHLAKPIDPDQLESAIQQAAVVAS
ncbi:MAG: PAS domain S-box protein [Bacillota bacterium]